MSQTDNIPKAAGRTILWILYIFIAASLWHSHAWASATIASLGAGFSFIPVGYIPFYTFKRKAILLIVTFVLMIIFFPDIVSAIP